MFSYPLGGDELAMETTDSAPNAPRSYVVDTWFDWGRDRRPRHWPEHTVIYELHVKGFTKLHPAVPEHLRGTYAGWRRRRCSRRSAGRASPRWS